MNTATLPNISPQPNAHQAHHMSFGATLLPDGGVRFRFWAPTAKTVQLVILDDPHTPLFYPMESDPDGFYECLIPTAHAGSRYQYHINNQILVPDLASRFQPDDVHGPSCVIDPNAFTWQDLDWKGRPWEEAVIYELHIGTFTPEGTYQAAEKKLPHLKALGITAIEVMPLADFPGERNWGYDGVLPFAPDHTYGSPDDLKHFIQTAHQHGIMVFLDVVYNHFGPEGNYIHAYAEAFFTDHHHTPWGNGLNFDDEGNEIVRSFFIHNALYWLEEYHFDGLRLDAVHTIKDDSLPPFLGQLVKAVQEGPGRHRAFHLILENEHNAASMLGGMSGVNTMGAAQQVYRYTAQWNDDFHHALHVLTTGETGGYYQDYAETPSFHLGRCLAEGFAYQGQPSPNPDRPRKGQPSKHLPGTAFIAFFQNHDQIGNRAMGDRVLPDEKKHKVALAVQLLAPQIPMLFMGEEWNSRVPFPFFCDLEPDLSQKVVEGRLKTFAGYPEYLNEQQLKRVPNPTQMETFQSAILDWESLRNLPQQRWLKTYVELLQIRREVMAPYLKAVWETCNTEFKALGTQALQVSWHATPKLFLLANFNSNAVPIPEWHGKQETYQLLYELNSGQSADLFRGILPPNSAFWFTLR